MAITKLHYKQRLLRVAKFLDNLPEEKFDFSYVISKFDENGCGAICCAIGWMPVMDPKNWKWGENGVRDVKYCYSSGTVYSNEGGWHYFGIPCSEFYDLFYSKVEVRKDFPVVDGETPWNMKSVKPHMLAHTIRRFVKEKF